MKLATTPEEMRQWTQQWRGAAIFTDEVKRGALANIADEGGWPAIEKIRSGTDGGREPAAVCGLIEQQTRFAKLRK
jgi:hypothetical protein